MSKKENNKQKPQNGIFKTNVSIDVQWCKGGHCAVYHMAICFTTIYYYT